MNSFQEHMVYNPNQLGCIQTTSSKPIKTVLFDGTNLSVYKEFEQNILMRAVNNASEDWDSKFTTLLTSTSGQALDGVLGYSGSYTMQNFIQALESLYYSYGKPRQYRNSLLNQLINDQYVNLNKPASVQRTNMIVLKLLNEFNDLESYEFVCNSIRMSEEAKASYKIYCVARQYERNLQTLSEWMTNTYNDLVESSSQGKSLKGGKPSKPPVLIKVLSSQSEEEASSTNEDC